MVVNIRGDTGVEIQPIDRKPNPEGGRPKMVPAGDPEVGKNVFFAGDVQSGASLVVRAMASGHAAADSVDAYFCKTIK